ncbi:MAG: sodium/solute symporter [Planctomycetia bacterium]|nr:sodium/solute symporter [Planctomycetia bacterium]
MDISLILTALFFCVLFLIALWGMHKTKTLNDFFLGGETLGPWILAISYGTAYFSAVVFIGFAGQFGWLRSFDALWIGVFNALCGAVLAWLVLGKQTRKMTRRLGAMTMPEFFSARYNTNGMKVVSALIIFLFLLPYSASVFAGLTYLFHNVFGLEMWIVLTVITFVTGEYIICGGYKAVARIDFLQGAIMFVGAILMVIFVVHYFGGFQEAISKSAKFYQERLAEGSANPGNPLGVKTIPGLIFWSVVFMTSFAPWALPQMVHKFYALKDEKQIVRGAIVCFAFSLVIGCSAYFVGALSHQLPSEIIDKAVVSGKVDTNALVPLIFLQALPKPLLALILLLVLSASMSTLSGLVLVASSAVSIDLYKGYYAPNRSDKHYLRIMRTLSLLFIVLSYVITLCNPSWIVPLMSLSWGAVAGSFLSPYLFGLFWRRTTKLGAYAGMWSGLIIVNGIYWGLYFKCGSGVAKAYTPVAASIAMVVPFFIVPIVSLMTKPVAPETVSLAFGDNENE